MKADESLHLFLGVRKNNVVLGDDGDGKVTVFPEWLC